MKAGKISGGRKEEKIKAKRKEDRRPGFLQELGTGFSNGDKDCISASMHRRHDAK